MEYNVDYFIKKFEAIPEKMWITCAFGYVGGPHCALGHCRYSFSNCSNEGKALIALLRTVVDINDGTNIKYQQSTPKKRILAALYDKKREQQPIIKEKIVYQAVDAKIEELITI